MRASINVKVEPRSTLTFTRALLYIVSVFFFTRVTLRGYLSKNYATGEIYPWGLRDGKATLLYVKKYLYKSSAVAYFPFLSGLCHF